LRVLCASAAEVICLFFLLSPVVAPLTAEAQTGAITGRVIGEDGGGLPNITVYLSPVASSQTSASNYQPDMVATDEEGNFRFTGLETRLYFVNVTLSKGYIYRPVPTSERSARGPYRIGDHITFTLVRGGVITGRVTASNGEPMIGVQVSAMRVKDSEGAPVRDIISGRPRTTDDRGVYRFYGLAPGAYVVFTRGGMSGRPISAYEGYAPTYHPSSPRETATEITITIGGEAKGVDIRYRGERGYTVSGAVLSAAPATPNAGTSVAIYNASTGFNAGTVSIRPGDSQNGFAIVGLTDGEYEIIARRAGAEPDEYFSSQPRRIAIRGADVGGIELKLEPLASVSGKVVVEPSPKICDSEHKPLLDEISVSARRDTPPALILLSPYQYGASMNDRGDFTIYNLNPSRYFIIARPQNERWYAKSIALPAVAGRRGSVRSVTGINVGRNGVTLKSGDRAPGLIVTIADGAASLRGRLAPENEGSRPPARMIIHILPAETASADDILRYAQMVAGTDGAFEFKNLAPGKYWLIAHAAPDDAPIDRPATPAAWDANERAKLRREAVAAKNEIALQPCGRVNDYVLRVNR
ncbi:MAG TPA: carboxypeptidase-like regulatory domain-containing protein, partial [Blastocatellia bacterium]|nr:carboxypeptidase-like regulatory domain-containing protein [Blastocatellia bacterium]